MSRIVQVEWAVRQIDMWGDCFDVDMYDTLASAERAAVSAREEAKLTIDSTCCAIVIEKETMREDGDVERETVLRMGSKDAMKKGGWL